MQPQSIIEPPNTMQPQSMIEPPTPMHEVFVRLTHPPNVAPIIPPKYFKFRVSSNNKIFFN